MLAAILAIVIAGAPPDSGAYVTWGARMPITDMAGTCRNPVRIAPRGDSIVYRWRVFGVPAANGYQDDSVRVARGDSVNVSMPVPRVTLWICYDWASKFGPPAIHGCAKRRLLATRMVP